MIGSSIGAGAGAAGVGGSYIASVGWSAAYGAACGATTGAYNALAFDGNVGTSALYGGLIGGFTGWISGLQTHEYNQNSLSLKQETVNKTERLTYDIEEVTVNDNYLVERKPLHIDSHFEFDGKNYNLVYDYCDGTYYVVDTWSAESGPWGEGALPNGEYAGSNLQIRTKDGMVRDGVLI